MSFEKPETLLDRIERAVNGLRLHLRYCPPPDEAQWAAACASLLAAAGWQIQTFEARITQLEDALRPFANLEFREREGKDYAIFEIKIQQIKDAQQVLADNANTGLLPEVVPPDAKDQTDHEQNQNIQNGDLMH